MCVPVNKEHSLLFTMEVNGEHTAPKRLGTSAKKIADTFTGKIKFNFLAPLIKTANGCGFVGGSEVVELNFIYIRRVMRVTNSFAS